MLKNGQKWSKSGYFGVFSGKMSFEKLGILGLFGTFWGLFGTFEDFFGTLGPVLSSVRLRLNVV